ncbi:MAG: hypothetical protein BRC58_10970 [Cyanobacteria bacterium QS_8_64_29]|jgi:hypothetical protein|nr:MAG: hypothetical protein BRC58_10970 [Cyanobacteria bacterium QS_8_64_29]
MARYTCSAVVAIPFEQLQASLAEVLQACHFDIIYDTDEYVMAREQPGRVNFSKLVTVEVLIDRTTATASEARLHFVVKNDELPLQLDNHCRQSFDALQQAVTGCQHWQLLEHQEADSSPLR